MASTSSSKLTPDSKELILCSDERFVCETYILEPAKGEEHLGYMFAVGEIEDRGGVGRELLDLTMSAVQREYYRDPSRSIATSFESALHQANLILHDSVEQGVKDWMGYFHVTICVLAGATLHLSVAGQATVTLIRKSSLTEISEGLAAYPVTNPLRTFSQVASGTLAARDTLYLGTANFQPLFRAEDLKRFAIDHSAATIATRLQQLYADHGLRHPLAVLVISLLPQYIVRPTGEARPITFGDTNKQRAVAATQASLRPRQPLDLRRSWLKTILVLAGRVAKYGWERLTREALPAAQRGSQALFQASRQKYAGWREARRNVPARPQLGPIPLRQLPKFHMPPIRKWLTNLPRSSRIFAVLAGVFAVALIVSLLLLQNKRAEDAAIQSASETLHAARVAKDAAEAELIYDNRDKARQLLQEAETRAEELAETGLYQEELNQLRSDIKRQEDRLQRIFRVDAATPRGVGNWSEFISTPENLRLFFVDGGLYTYDPASNAILMLTSEGTASRVTQTSTGIGFFTDGAVQYADKTMTLGTDAPGIALFDTTDNSLLRQEITFPQENVEIGSIGVFGNRLYILDTISDNIYSFDKTLRGFSGGTVWITDEGVSRDTIEAIAIDGNIFTLHSDGSLERLFRGEATDFEAEPVDPALTGATNIITTEEHQYVYVVDPTHKRVVIFTKEGQLSRQIFLDSVQNMQDAAIGPKEDTLYVLDGTSVVTVSLSQDAD